MALFVFTPGNRLSVIVLFMLIKASSNKELFLDESNICSLGDNDGVIRLGRDEVVVSQRNSFSGWTGRYSYKCSFVVKPPKDHGVYAVIQRLALRKNEVNGYCKDYVTFRESLSVIETIFRKPDMSDKFCGFIESGISTEEGYNSYTSSGGMKVYIYGNNEKLNPFDKLDLKIAFTAFENVCLKGRSKDNDFKCKPCEVIWKSLVNNNIQNCPNCKDEDVCGPPSDTDDDLNGKYPDNNIYSSSGTGTKVTVGAVATILLLLVLFGMFLWICKKTQRLCWSSYNNGPRMEMNRPRGPQREENSPSPNLAGIEPSAPPEPDIKDLPPSYNSLFPNK